MHVGYTSSLVSDLIGSSDLIDHLILLILLDSHHLSYTIATCMGALVRIFLIALKEICKEVLGISETGDTQIFGVITMVFEAPVITQLCVCIHYGKR